MADTAKHVATSKAIASAAYFCAFAGLGLCIAALGPTLLDLADATDSSLTTMGYIFTARATGYLSGAIVSGYLFDLPNAPAHLILAVALLATGIGTAIVPSTGNIFVVGAAVSTAGIGMGFLDTGGNVLLIRLHGSEVGPYMQAMHFSFALGALLSPLAIKWLATPENPIQHAYWLFSAFNIACAFWIALLPAAKSPAADSTDGSKGAASGFLSKSAGGLRVQALTAAVLCIYVGCEVSATHSPFHNTTAISPHRPQHANANARWRTADRSTLCTHTLCTHTLQVAYGGWIHTYSVEQLGLSKEGGHDMTAVFWGALAVGRYCCTVSDYC
jgi:FHS family Na+ dependent glucose MFS transporter 1